MSDASVKILISMAPESRAALQGGAKDIASLSAALKALSGANASQAASGLNTLGEATNAAAKGAKEHSKATAEQAEAMGGLSEVVERVTGALKFMAGGFLALESIRFFKELADNAARAQVLGTVLHVVGQNAGYTRDQLDTTDQSIQRLGITAQASRQSLTQLIQSQLDLSHATILARNAQDLAVISGENSSQTFQRLIHAIEVQSVMDLRFLGINVRKEEAEKRYAESIHKTSEALTDRERKQAFALAVETAASRLSGSYAAAMGDVGKQLTSLDRLTTNLSTSMGQTLLPAYLAIVQQFSLFLEEATDQADAYNAASDGGKKLASVVETLAIGLREVAVFFVEHYKLVAALGVGFLGLAGRISYVAVAQTSLGRLIGAGAGEFLSLSGAVLSTAKNFAYYAQFVSLVVKEEGILSAIQFILGARLTGLIAAGGRWVTTLALQVSTEGLLSAATGTLTAAFESLWAVLLANPLGVVVALLGGMVAGLGEALKNAKDLVPGAQWIDVWNGGLRAMKNLADDAFTAIGKFSTGDFSGGAKSLFGGKYGSSTQQDDIRSAMEERLNGGGQKAVDAGVARLRRTREDLLTAANKYNATGEGTPERAAAKQEFDQLRKNIEEQQKQLTVLEQRNHLTADQVKALDATAAAQKKLTEATAQAFDAADAKDKLLGEGQATKDGFLSKKYNEDIGGLRKLVDAVHDLGKESGITNEEVQRGLRNTLDSVSTPGELKNIQATIAAWKQEGRLAGDAAKEYAQGLALARDRVAKTERARVEPLVANSREDAKNRDEKTVNEAQHTANVLQESNRLIEAKSKQDYDRGLVTIADYYAQRAKLIDEAFKVETAVRAAHIRELEDQRKNTQDPRQRAGITNQIQAARNAQLEAVDKAAGDKRTLGLEEDQERYEITKNLTAQQVSLNKEIGGYDQKIAAVTEKYRLMRLETKGIAPGIIDALEAQDKLKASIDETEKTQSRANATFSAEVALQKAKLAAAVDAGTVSPAQQMEANNAIIRQQQTNLREQQASAQAEIDRYQQEINRIAAENAKTGDTTDVTAYQEAISDLLNKSKELDAQVIQLGTGLESYGKQIRKSLESDIGDALTNVIVNFKSAQNTVVDLGKKIESTLISIVAKNAVSKLMDSVFNKPGDPNTPRLDAQGNPVKKSGGIFSGLGDLLGVGGKKGTNPVGTRINPSYTYVLNQSAEKTPVGVGNVTAPNSGSDKGLLDDSLDLAKSLNFGGGDIASSLSNIGMSLASNAKVQGLFGFADGINYVPGHGTDTSDNIPAMLSPGEGVVTAKANRKYPGLVSMLNSDHPALQSIARRGGTVPHFAEGGTVGGGGMGVPGGAGMPALVLHPDMAHWTVKDVVDRYVSNAHAGR